MTTPCRTDQLLLRIGLFGIGLDVYWPQFRALKDRLESHLPRASAHSA